MSKYIIIIFCSLLFGCKCVQKEEKAQQNSLINATEKLEEFLPQKTFEVLNNVDEISFFKVVPTLIEGTKDEYSNKSVFVRYLSEEEKNQLLLQLKSDESYQWDNYSEDINFKVSYQLVCKSENGQFNLLTNKENTMVSFISLDGQSVIPIHKNLNEFLNNLIH